MDSKGNIAQLSEKEKKALEKAQRKAEFEAKFNKENENKPKQSDKTAAQLKAERRAKQEAQRAAKAQERQPSQQKPLPQKPESSSKNDITKSPIKEILKVTSTPVLSISDKKNQSDNSNKELPNKILSHLPRRVLELSELSTDLIPYPVIQVGYQINKKIIKGPTEKCVAMLTAFKEVVEKYQPSPNQELKRELQKILFVDCLHFLSKCRPLQISMTNAVKHLKLIFSRIQPDIDEKEVKTIIVDAIDDFIKDEIILSRQAIVVSSLKKINENDIILTLGCSPIVKHVLSHAAQKGKKFKVIVVDTRPRFEGREMLEFLVKNNIPSTYILINSISYVMKEVTKVIIEGHSLLGNGYVMSHIGSSQIALVAKAYNVPVIVCCETYKFSDRVHTDCFVYNELGEDIYTFFDSIGKKCLLESEAFKPFKSNLIALDLLFDLTPHEFVSVVITEKGMLPCTSVPAILRVRETK